MSRRTDHPLVRDYLERLRAEARRLPALQAHDLYADIREHLHSALSEHATDDEVRDQLRRTGTPAQLVDECDGARPVAEPAPARPTRDGLLLGAIVALVGAEVGFFLVPFSGLAWIAGLVMLALVPTRTSRLKVRAFLALGTGFPLMVVMLTGVWGGVGETCTSSSSMVDGRLVNSPEVCTSTGPGPWLPIVAGILLLAYLVWQALTVRALLKRED